MNILITGGAGFIGSALIRYLIQHSEHHILNVDKLTYAANLSALSIVADHPRYQFSQTDICDGEKFTELFALFQPDAVMHLAAESHVDRSIQNAQHFIQSNIVGTYQLLETARHWWQALSPQKQAQFRFHHISTDEVFGDLAELTTASDEQSAYLPNSPYSASKAASDHLVRAWGRTYGIPVLLSHSTNNYGAFQHNEKFIPHMINQALQGNPLPIYGNGLQIRDWLFVDDHVNALYRILCKGKIGESYNIAGNNQWRNIDVVKMICDILEQLAPHKPKGVKHYRDLICHVQDRPGHDFRYALNCEKIQQELQWQPTESFESGLRKTVMWYLENAL